MEFSRLVLAGSIATLLATPFASAAIYHWQTDGSTNVWSSGAEDTNWFLEPTNVLAPWVNGNDAVIDSPTAGETITLTGALTPLTTTVGAGGGNWRFGGSGTLGGTLIKEGSGTLTLGTNSNKLSGTIINGGTISIGAGGTGAATGSVNALGTGEVKINSGGTLKLWLKANNAATAPFVIPNAISIDGGTIHGEDGINAIGGTVRVGEGGATFTSRYSGKTLSFTNVISGTGTVTVQRVAPNLGNPDSTVIMTGRSTYTGGTIVNSGVLQLGADLTKNNGSAGIVVGEITVNSPGTLSLRTINALGYGAGKKVDTINVNGGLVLHEANGDNGWGLTYNMTGGALRSTSATGRFSFGGGTSVNTFDSPTSATIDGNVVLRDTNGGSGVVFTIEDGAAQNDFVINATMNESGGAFGIRKEGAGTMALTGNVNYTGATLINAGTLLLTNSAQFGSSAITVNDGGTFRVGNAGKSVFNILANDGARLALPAHIGGTTSVMNQLTIPEGSTASIVPEFVARPEKNQVFDLVTAGAISPGGSIATVLDPYGPTRVTGTTEIIDNSIVRLTVTQGAADLLWTNAQGNGVWDLNNTANFFNSGANDVFLSADSVTFDDSAPGDEFFRTVNLAGTLAPSLITVNNSASTYVLDFGKLAGPGSVVKSGSSDLILGWDLDFEMTGGITVNDGAFDLGGKVVHLDGPITMNNGRLYGGTVTTSSLNLREGTVGVTVEGTGPLNKTGAGTAILTANNSYTGLNTVTEGTLQVGDRGETGTLGTGALVIESGATVRFDRSNNYGDITNNISGSGSLIFDGVSASNRTQYALTGDNSGFFGSVTILEGRVYASNTAGNRFGSAELIAVGKETSSGQFWLTGGTYSNNFTISGLGWLENLGRLGAIRMSNGPTIAGNITLAGDARISAHGTTGTISGVIAGSAGLELGGTSALSTITLTGANTYTGPTTITNALVNVTGSLASSMVTVGDDGTIAGTGTLGGSLTFGTVNGGAKLAANGNSEGALHVNGEVNVFGATPVGVTLTSGSFMSPGTPFTILTFGATAATASDFTLANATSFRQGIFAVGPNSVTVDIGSKAVAWKGTAGNAWDINTSANWADSGDVVEKYFQGDAVTFGEAGAGSLTLPVGLTPYRVTVNSDLDYAFNGGSISSPNPLVKDGSGTLLLNTAGTYAGGVIVNGGTVALDGPRTYNRLQPNAPVVVNDGGTFEVRGVNPVEDDELAIDVTLNQGGTLRVVSGNSALSTSTSHVHFRTLNLNGGTVDLTYSGSGVSYHGESFAIGTNGINVGGSTPSSIIMTGDATNEHVGIGLIGSRAFTVNDVTGSPAVDFLVAAEIEDGNAGPGSLVKMGTGTMLLAADTSYTGFTQVSEGTLLVNSKLNGTTGIEVSPGATFGGDGTIAPGGSGTISVQGEGTLAPGIGLGTLTLDSLNTNANVLSLLPDAVFVFELNTGIQSDRIALTNGAFGDIAFSGNTINFLDLSSGLLEAGTYTLFTADVEQAYTGLIFDSAGFITEGLQIGSGLEAYSELSLQLQGNDIVLNVVPEPASVATFAGGVAMLLGMRRRRKN